MFSQYQQDQENIENICWGRRDVSEAGQRSHQRNRQKDQRHFKRLVARPVSANGNSLPQRRVPRARIGEATEAFTAAGAAVTRTKETMLRRVASLDDRLHQLEHGSSAPVRLRLEPVARGALG